MVTIYIHESPFSILEKGFRDEEMADSRELPKQSRAQTVQARSARKNPSVAEQIAWKILRGRQCGFKFRREFPVHPYRLDFYCHEAKFAIEFDGEQHDSERDRVRDAKLAEFGILVYRIPNREFFHIENEGKLIDHLTIALNICEARVRELGTL